MVDLRIEVGEKILDESALGKSADDGDGRKPYKQCCLFSVF